MIHAVSFVFCVHRACLWVEESVTKAKIIENIFIPTIKKMQNNFTAVDTSPSALHNNLTFIWARTSDLKWWVNLSDNIENVDDNSCVPENSKIPSNTEIKSRFIFRQLRSLPRYDRCYLLPRWQIIIINDERRCLRKVYQQIIKKELRQKEEIVLNPPVAHNSDTHLASITKQ